MISNDQMSKAFQWLNDIDNAVTNAKRIEQELRNQIQRLVAKGDQYEADAEELRSLNSKLNRQNAELKHELYLTTKAHMAEVGALRARTEDLLRTNHELNKELNSAQQQIDGLLQRV